MSTENTSSVELTEQERELIAAPFRQERIALQDLMTAEGRALHGRYGDFQTEVEVLRGQLAEAEARLIDARIARDADYSCRMYSVRWDESFGALQAALCNARAQKIASLAVAA